MSEQKRISGNEVLLYFGSFNPIHIGHLVIANFMVEFTDIDELWFVVSPHNPHKKKINLLNDYDRLELAWLAVEGDDRLRVSDIEFHLPRPSYTVDTLAYLKDQHPKNTFKILMGSDNLKNFHKWKNYETITDNYGIVVYPRPGFDHSKITQHPNIIIAENAPLMEISSSFIRDAIKKGKNVRYFVPQKTWEYIEKMRLYK